MWILKQYLKFAVLGFLCFLSFAIPDEPYCYVRQYALYGMSRGKFTAYIYMCSLCTAIHNYSSSGSLFFATLRWNN